MSGPKLREDNGGRLATPLTKISWWLGLPRDGFTATATGEAERMKASTFSRPRSTGIGTAE